MNAPTLHSQRLLLRPFTRDDLPAVYEIFRDETVNRFLPWFALRSLQEAEDFWREHLANERQNLYCYAICLQRDEVPVGYIHLGREDACDLGYGLCRAFWRQGLASEAGQLLLAQAQADGVPFVTATHDVNNPASGRVMQRLGMRYQYSYREQWQPKNIPVTFRMYQRNLDGDADRVYKGYWQRYPEHFVETAL